MSAPLRPKLLRAIEGVASSELARRLRITEDDLRTLEAAELRFLEVGELRSYLEALGYELTLEAVCKRGGKREVLG